MCGCISEEELLKNGDIETLPKKSKKKNLPLPAGLHIESGWADKERAELENKWSKRYFGVYFLFHGYLMECM